MCQPTATTPTPAAASRTGSRPSPLLALFLVSLALPLIFFLGPLRLSPYRLLLLVAVLPLFFSWLSDETQRKRPCDWLMIFYVFWTGFAMLVVMGPGDTIEPFGMRAIETFGAYFLARRYVRDAESYEFVVRWMFRIVSFLLPLALIEAFTGREITLDIFRLIGRVFPVSHMEPRLGFDRVQGPFEHPILFGVFCGSVIGMVAFLDAHIRARLWRVWIVFFTALWSLSSGPLAGIIAQIMMGIYERITRGMAKRWSKLGVSLLAVFIIVDLISNRGPFQVFISYFALNMSTAYNRLRIWEYGSASVLNHPFFGLGMEGDFERPIWMSNSADMFWLVLPLKFGLPAGLAFIGACLYIAVRMARAPIADPRTAACRTGLLISLLGIFISGWTVHFWNATYVLVVFLFGAGVWIFDAEHARGPGPRSGGTAPPDDAPPADGPPRRRTIL